MEIIDIKLRDLLVENGPINLISNFVSQKVTKINFNKKKYEFIIKYNKRFCIKLSPRPPNSLSRPGRHPPPMAT